MMPSGLLASREEMRADAEAGERVMVVLNENKVGAGDGADGADVVNAIDEETPEDCGGRVTLGASVAVLDAEVVTCGTTGETDPPLPVELPLLEPVDEPEVLEDDDEGCKVTLGASVAVREADVVIAGIVGEADEPSDVELELFPDVELDGFPLSPLPQSSPD